MEKRKKKHIEEKLVACNIVVFYATYKITGVPYRCW